MDMKPSPPAGALDLFPHNHDWSIQTLRLVVEGIYGGSDINEVYRTVAALQGKGVSEWPGAWEALAQQTVRTAAQAEAAGHVETARDAYFRAFNYFRHAEFYLGGADPEKIRLYTLARNAFRSAIPHANPRVEPIAIPFEGQMLEGYFCHPPEPKKGPVVVFLGGADSTAEELLFFGARALTDRGMYVCMVDTPGRGSAVRLKGMSTRPDYETAVRPVIDYVASRPEVDPDRIGLLGLSMGGYYAPRVAAYDDRVRALACWCACFDVLTDIYEFYPPIRPQLEWISGAASPEDARTRLAEFHLRDAAPRITCPTLITHGETDTIISVEAAQKLFDALQCEKELRIWTESEGGAIHCNYDSFGAVIPYLGDWLADQLMTGTGAPRNRRLKGDR